VAYAAASYIFLYGLLLTCAASDVTERRQHIIGDSALTTDELSESMGTSFRISIQGTLLKLQLKVSMATEKVQMLRASITNNQK
jgi:hypothetical protein